MDNTFICIWCQKEFPLSKRTKEHLLPVCLGGDDSEENIKYACSCCNNKRGLIPSAYGNMLCIAKKIGGWKALNELQRKQLRKRVGRFRKKLKVVKEEQQKWACLESQRLGRSFSDKIILKVPKLRVN